MALEGKAQDDFWDIEKLLPKKRAGMAPFSMCEKTVDTEIPSREEPQGPEEPQDPDRGKLTLPFCGGETLEESYAPATPSLIRRVTIRRRPDRYDFYGNFRKAALIYFDYKTPPCEFVPFYSYMPQYSQMTPEQKSYYFFWRGEVRRGKYLRSDYSYIYLYIYEILNLPDRFPPEQGLACLLEVWREYRPALPRLDIYLSSWVQDYCLLYNLPAPTAQIADFLPSAVNAATFREFYLSDANMESEASVLAMIAYLSDYDWSRGKYAGGEHAAGYRHHVLGAMRCLLTELWQSGEWMNESRTALFCRDAFAASLCTHTVKCRLEVEYYPLSGSAKLRQAVTAAVKYTENRLRAALGVKSRLAVRDLPDAYRRTIDRYFAGVMAGRPAVKVPEAEYMQLYEAPQEELSTAGADVIERASWATTRRLVEGTDESDDISQNDLKIQGRAEEPQNKSEPQQATCGVESALPETAADYLAALLRGDAAAALAVCRAAGVSPESVAEEINEASLQEPSIADVVLEPAETGYVLIKDYREEAEIWNRKMRK